MLMRLFLTAMFLFSANVLACWKGEGTFAVDGESWRIDQKFESNKEYLLGLGTYILKLSVISHKKNRPSLRYTIQERKENVLVLVSRGEEEDFVTGESKDIYAKGEEGKPNSIISIKLINI